MKKIFIALTLLASLAAACQKHPQETDCNNNPLSVKLVGGAQENVVQGSLLVKFTANAAKEMKNGNNVLEGVDIKDFEPLFRFAGDSDRHGLSQWYEITFDKSIDPKEIARQVSEDKDVEAVEYNALIEHSCNHESVDYITSPAVKSAASSQTEDLPFNDPELPKQWHLINTGNQDLVPHSVAGADVGVKDAWRLCTGDNRVIVAVFDVGVMTFHADLKDVMWKNERETPNGKDDDGNGYKDDIYGYNFADDKGGLVSSGSTPEIGHGTHVAGIIAARNGNGKGVSSIAGGSGATVYDGVRIMSCQIFNEIKYGNGFAVVMTSASKVAKAFEYAAQMGACIAQCSFRVAEDEEGNMKFRENTAEYAALKAFTEKSNCAALDQNLAIFSAGNYNAGASDYPGIYPFCISVTAFGPDFLPGGYSNHGTGCDISAPGGNPCLVPENEIGKDLRTCILSTGVVATTVGSYIEGGYAYNYGTSMACPMVSGVAALGLSYALKLGKTFTRDEFVSRLLTSTTDIDSYMLPGSQTFLNNNTGKKDTFDPSTYKGKMGSGAVDAWKFLMSLEGTPTVLTKPQKEISIDLSKYLGYGLSGFDYTVSVDEASRNSLGIEGDFNVTGGVLTLTCGKIGAGKITVSGSIKDGRDDGFVREISIVSRSAATNNGGWM